MSEYDALLTKIETKEAVVGIVGLGYVGLPLAMAFVDRIRGPRLRRERSGHREPEEREIAYR
jgi:hypothetical protein